MRKRTRERDERVTLKFRNPTINVTLDPDKVWRTSSSQIRVGRYQKHTDVIGDPSLEDHYCDHLKRETSFKPFMGSWETNLYEIRSAEPMMFAKSNINSAFWMDFPTHDMPYLSNNEKLKLHMDAADKVQPTFQGETNLINFLYELKDLRKPLQKAVDIASFLKYIGKLRSTHTADLQSVYQFFFNKTKKDPSVLESLADKHLAYAFGIRPLISDMKAFYEQATTINDRVLHLMNHSGLLCCSHYKKTIEDTFSSGDASSDTSKSFGIPFSRKTFLRYVFKYFGTLRFYYEMPDLTNNANALKATLDTMGFNLGASVLWNALPFSFVVDWFVDTSDILRPYDFQWTDWNFRIRSGCYSLKYKGFDWATMKTNKSSDHEYWRCDTRHYRRDKLGHYALAALNKPEVLFPSFKMLGLNQQLLAFSLGVSLTR